VLLVRYRCVCRECDRQVKLVWVERLLTVEFGPSRSKRFRKAVEEARSVWGAKTRSACKFDVFGVQVKVLVSHAPAIS
jgi:hypothetical protein